MSQFVSPRHQMLLICLAFKNLFLSPAQLIILTLCATLSDHEDSMSGSARVSGSSLAWRSHESLKSLK